MFELFKMDSLIEGNLISIFWEALLLYFVLTYENLRQLHPVFHCTFCHLKSPFHIIYFEKNNTHDEAKSVENSTLISLVGDNGTPVIKL